MHRRVGKKRVHGDDGAATAAAAALARRRPRVAQAADAGGGAAGGGAAGGDAAGGDAAGDKERDDAARALSIELHMNLLHHVVTCVSVACVSVNCRKMRGFLQHAATCDITVVGGANCAAGAAPRADAGPCHARARARRLWKLLNVHAQQCTVPTGTCRIPRCADVKAAGTLIELTRCHAAAVAAAPAQEPECVICWIEGSTYRVIPCGHLCLCAVCAAVTVHCPVCHGRATAFVEWRAPRAPRA